MKNLKSIVQRITSKAVDVAITIFAYVLVALLVAAILLVPTAVVCISIKAILLCFGG